MMLRLTCCCDGLRLQGRVLANGKGGLAGVYYVINQAVYYLQTFGHDYDRCMVVLSQLAALGAITVKQQHAAAARRGCRGVY
jgi:hypothetical protein